MQILALKFDHIVIKNVQHKSTGTFFNHSTLVHKL